MALSENMRFITGPQGPITNSFFDQTQLSMARMLGKECPPVPPVKPAAPVEPLRKDFADDATYREAYNTWAKDPVIISWMNALNHYTLHLQYYDLGGSEYAVHARTDDPEFLGYARNAVDSFWKHPWINEGRERPWPDNASPPPRHVGIRGFLLRGLDGRPEMLDYCVAYTREFLNIYFLWRLPAKEIHVDLREGAFVFHFATWIVKALPDSFPNAAQIRAEFHAKLVRIVNEYYVPLQSPCGCWLYDINMPDTDGGTLVQTTQPFTIGLLLLALWDFQQITTDTSVREILKAMILKTSKHLYLDGPYRKDEPIPFDPTKRWRAFWYLYHGGTTVNPTKFAKGGWSYPGNSVDEVMDARQSIGPVIAIYGAAYRLSGDPIYLEAAKEMWDAAYGLTDGIGTYYNTDGKGFNQHCARAGSLWPWAGVPQPVFSTPTPGPTPTPTPGPTPPKPGPVAQLTSPAEGAKLSGQISITASVTDSTSVIDVVYLVVDGLVVGSTGSAPYAFSFDTKKLADGPHTISVRAWNKLGESGDSRTINVTVSNAVAPTPDPSPTPTPTPTPTPGPAEISIGGKILKKDGTPNKGVRVMINPGAKIQMFTKDDGSFIFTKLKPGKYVVIAGASNAWWVYNPGYRAINATQDINNADFTAVDSNDPELFQ